MTKKASIKTWNRIAPVYDFVLSTEERAYNQIKKRIVSSIDYDDKILELASGSGTIALDLCPHCRFVEATDISEEMIRKAEILKSHSRYKNVNFKVADVYNIDAHDDTYDVIIMSNTLHILDMPDTAIEEIKRVLKPGGKLIIPNFIHKASLRSTILSHVITTFGYPTKRRYSEQALTQYIENHNFAIHKSVVIKGTVPIAYIEAINDVKVERAPIIIK